MKLKYQTQLVPLVALLFFLNSCAAILPGNDPVIVNAQRTLTAGHATVYGLYRLEADSYSYFKSKAPDQAVAVRRGVNVVRENYPAAEKTAWNAVEAYREHRTSENKANVSTYLAVFRQIVSDAQNYVSKINAGGN